MHLFFPNNSLLLTSDWWRWVRLLTLSRNFFDHRVEPDMGVAGCSPDLSLISYRGVLYRLISDFHAPFGKMTCLNCYVLSIQLAKCQSNTTFFDIYQWIECAHPTIDKNFFCITFL